MARLRGSGPSRITQANSYLSLFISFASMMVPAWANSPSGVLGAIVYAERAHIGSAVASVGATVYGGDRLSTEENGSLQLRAAKARILLSGSSSASFEPEETIPSATLLLGTATFSTSDSKAFLLHVAAAAIRPDSDRPTIGRVTILKSNEFIVRSTMGSLSLAVEDDVRVIAEGAAYRVVFEQPSSPEPQGPGGVGSKDYRKNGALKAGRSRFKWFAIATVSVVTYFAASEALESPDRP